VTWWVSADTASDTRQVFLYAQPSASSPPVSTEYTFLVEWSGTDGGSGIASYDVQVKAGDGAWQNWQVGTAETSADYTAGENGQTYCFRCRARDQAGNVESWPDEADACTALQVPVHTVKKYYYAGGQRVAVRTQPDGLPETLHYFHADHLGSTSALSNESGGLLAGSLVRYHPFGSIREGTLATIPSAAPTDYGFTGQRFHGTMGLYHIGARFYDPALGRWLSADTIVPEPGEPQDFNRYSYVRNSPLNYVDPTGHVLESDGGGGNPPERPPEQPPDDYAEQVEWCDAWIRWLRYTRVSAQ
jgi:RHS repeat-associated protein